MNRLTMMLIPVTMLTGLLSCGSDDNEETVKKENILNAAPFSGITDSIADSPDDPELLLRRATLLSQNNLHPLATDDYKKAWELTQDENIALIYASNLLLTDSVQKAEDLLKDCETKFPESTEFNRRLAELYTERGEYNKAMEEYDRILAKDSGNFEAWFDKGNLLLKMKDTVNAVMAMEASFSLLPANYSGIALANIYAAKKNPRVLEICDILLARDSASTQTDPHYMKGVYYSETKQYDKAISEFDKCIKLDWKLTDAYIEKGIILFERKKTEEAKKVFNLAITVSNTDPDAYYWLGRCFEAQGRTKEAIENYQRAVSLDDTFTEAKTAIKRLNGK
ncbi:MAG: tetratricopeptide repeat protein [Chitinophagaceae bacterium]|nr:tetratricopeptide repeat protein [Chitinophagaceae bacterium]